MTNVYDEDINQTFPAKGSLGQWIYLHINNTDCKEGCLTLGHNLQCDTTHVM